MPRSDIPRAVVVPAYNEQDSIAVTIEALARQSEPAPAIFVDNASTDDTPNIIHDRSNYYASQTGHPLIYVHEAKKGTGTAVDTGFRHAISALGAEVIARTDADSAPEPDWLARLAGRLESDKGLQLVGGRVIGLRDKYYRLGDDMLFPIGVRAVFAARSLIESGSMRYARPVMGGNMATRATSYIETGGFPHTDISLVDEDIVYMQAVIDDYGRSAVAHVPEARVRTSMRRLRDLGYVGMLTHFSAPNRRLKRPMKCVDVR